MVREWSNLLLAIKNPVPPEMISSIFKNETARKVEVDMTAVTENPVKQVIPARPMYRSRTPRPYALEYPSPYKDYSIY